MKMCDAIQVLYITVQGFYKKFTNHSLFIESIDGWCKTKKGKQGKQGKVGKVGPKLEEVGNISTWKYINGTFFRV